MSTSPSSPTISCGGNPVTFTASSPDPSVTFSWNNGVINGMPFVPSVSNYYNLTATASNGCTTSAAWYVPVYPTCQATLNILMYIQGYYQQGMYQMSPALYNQGSSSNPWACDSILVELHDTEPPYSLLFSKKELLDIYGNILVKFPISTIGNDYYLSLKGSNILETWSTNPITMNTVTAYDFSTAQYNAYGNNQQELEFGVWALYSGDVDQNGYLELDDYNLWDIEYQAGYLHNDYTPDLDGNGYVELDDYNIWDANYQNGVYSLVP